MGKGWIKLHRRIHDHWIYQEKRQFSRYEAWIDLIMMANHKSKEVLIDNELIEIEKGQLITSIRKLCDKWDWSNTKVTNFLKLLQKDRMITYKSDTKKTVISICNYRAYNDSDKEESDTKTTDERHENISETHQKHTNKNVKNLKNDKKYKDDDDIGSIFSEEFDRLFVQTFHQEPSPKQIEILQSFMDDGLKLDLLEWALEETNLRMGQWSYFHKILSNCLNNKTFTREQALLAGERRREKRKGNVTPLRRVDHAITQSSDYVTNEYDWESFTVRG